MPKSRFMPSESLGAQLSRLTHRISRGDVRSAEPVENDEDTEVTEDFLSTVGLPVLAGLGLLVLLLIATFIIDVL